jgi:hypothetical protein
LKLEAPLVRIGDIGLKLKFKNDEDPITPEADENGKADKFVPALIASDVHMRIEGHSHSPLFGDESREIAVLLKKAEAISNEMFVRMLNPPNRDNIINEQRRLAKAKARLAQQHPEMMQQHAAGGKKAKGAR